MALHNSCKFSKNKLSFENVIIVNVILYLLQIAKNQIVEELKERWPKQNH